MAEDVATRPVKEPVVLEDITVATDTTEDQQEALLQLLNKYRAAFAKNIYELGCTNVVQMDIVETKGSVPVCAKPYRTSPSDRQIIADIIRTWSKTGLVSDSTLPYASPVLLVNKSNSEKRLCVDYHRLNSQIETPPYPMPDIDSQLSSLAAANMFTTLDLSHGFLQIPLAPESKEKTAFITEDTIAKFERMPFGLKGAPGTFQKLMSIIFKDLKQAGTVNTYLDDIIMFYSSCI